MKILGLHKKSSLHTWGLRGFIGIIIDGWKDAIRFSVSIKRKVTESIRL